MCVLGVAVGLEEGRRLTRPPQGIRSVELMTNNPLKEQLLRDFGVSVVRRRSCLVRRCADVPVAS
jgi:hypothetical protein